MRGLNHNALIGHKIYIEVSIRHVIRVLFTWWREESFYLRGRTSWWVFSRNQSARVHFLDSTPCGEYCKFCHYSILYLGQLHMEICLDKYHNMIHSCFDHLNCLIFHSNFVQPCQHCQLCIHHRDRIHRIDDFSLTMCLILRPSLLPIEDHIRRELFDNCPVDPHTRSRSQIPVAIRWQNRRYSMSSWSPFGHIFYIHYFCYRLNRFHLELFHVHCRKDCNGSHMKSSQRLIVIQMTCSKAFSS